MTRHMNSSRRATRAQRMSANRQLRAGFTLVEMLVVIVIIGILAAILLPVLGRAREGARQANCASNLKTLYFAIAQYKQDTKRYPSSMAFLLPKPARLDNDPATVGVASTDASCDSTTIPGVPTCANTGGANYLTGAQPFLCPDDPNDDLTVPRSSYGAITTGMPAANPVPDSINMSRYVWNYWGYSHQGAAYARPSDAATDLGADLGKYLTTPFATNTTADATAWATEAGSPTLGSFRTNPLANSMSNRNTAGTTILTHCVYHRGPTSGLTGPEMLYTDAAGTTPDASATSPNTSGTSAQDIVLRADGSAVKPQVGTWTALRDGSSNWQKQLFQVQP